MDFRNKYAIHTTRTLFALFLLFAGISGLYFILSGAQMPEMSPNAMIAFAGFSVTGIIYVAKATEIIAGLLLLANFRPALGNLLIAPITVGILVYDIALGQSETYVMVALMVALNAYLGYVYWDKYKAVFTK